MTKPPDLSDALLARVKATHDPVPTVRPGTRAGRGSAVYASAFGRRLFRVHLHTSVEMVALIDRAAARRGVNRSSYIRRAVALMVAADLGLPVRDVLVHSPGIGPYGGMQADRGSRDNGENIQTWCTHPGCDGSHLR